MSVSSTALLVSPQQTAKDRKADISKRDFLGLSFSALMQSTRVVRAV